ncbi:protocatechuate 3,4-dioxygenase (plasmid) [Roseomonas gilardii subsp. gilardii]|uniref:protocatechuate 3,4-dioxygenase n=1 Tax=Roseomonas gilardii TaxID=257708 RepID=UPI001FF7996F|nr:protocatechuate 3,4-dioxygenase [Roseomonas gilardii]UPG74542.1 protocatechuate 3,4-dioxygenase [Roseomonas gilardii subsp. gilardii]
MEATERMLMGIFNGEDAQRGYALNKMCHSLNDEGNRREFMADIDAYCSRYGLNDQQRAAVKSRKKNDLLAAGVSLYFLTKLARAYAGGPLAPVPRGKAS